VNSAIATRGAEVGADEGKTMPIELEDGRVLLTEAERQKYRAAAVWIAEAHGRIIDLQSAMPLGDLVDLIHARYVVEDDVEALQQINCLFEAEIARRRNVN
jgi:hypothetical protein